MHVSRYTSSSCPVKSTICSVNVTRAHNYLGIILLFVHMLHFLKIYRTFHYLFRYIFQESLSLHDMDYVIMGQGVLCVIIMIRGCHFVVTFSLVKRSGQACTAIFITVSDDDTINVLIIIILSHDHYYHHDHPLQ